MTKILSSALALVATLLAATSPSVAAPMRISVPAYLRYCMSSNPVDASKFDLPEVREEIFDTLYDRIEKTALNAGLHTIGVPFVDGISQSAAPPPAPGLAAAPAPAPAAVPEPTVQVKVCVVTPSDGAASLPAAGLENVQAHDVYAMLCQADQIAACQRDLETLLRSENTAPADARRRTVFRTRQAISTTGDAASLISALTDSTILRLRDDAPKTSPGGQTIVESAELAGGS